MSLDQMPLPPEQPSIEGQDLEEVMEKFQALAAVSLTSAVRHTDVWRAGQHKVQSENIPTMYDQWRKASLDVLLQGHSDVETEGIFPDEIYICVAEFDYTQYPDMGGGVEGYFLLSFRYGADQSTARDVCISMKIGEPQIVSYVLDHDAIETGYEGHGHQYWELNVPTLQVLYSIIDGQLRGGA